MGPVVGHFTLYQHLNTETWLRLILCPSHSNIYHGIHLNTGPSICSRQLGYISHAITSMLSKIRCYYSITKLEGYHQELLTLKTYHSDQLLDIIYYHNCIC